MRKSHQIYRDSANGAYVHFVFSYSSLAILTIELKDLYIGYMRNREKGIQIIGPNLNGLGLKIQWIGLLSPNII